MATKKVSKKDVPKLETEIEELTLEVDGESEELALDLEELTIDLEGALDFVNEDESGEALSLDVEEESPEDAKAKVMSAKKKAAAEVRPAVKIAAPLSEIEEMITSIDDSVEYLTWVIYGKNGTGKTTMLATADGVLILAPEDGTLSLKGRDMKNARKLRVDSWDKIEAVYWLLNSGKRVKDGIEINTKEGKFVVKYLAIDTVTKLAEVCMRNVVLGEREHDASKDILSRTMRNWGDMSERMKYWLQQFSELPLQNVWLFQESSNSEDVESDEFSIFPAVNKSLRTYVLSEADIIARTYIAKSPKGIQWRMSAAPNPNYVTKDRTSMINTAAINNPHLSKLYAKFFEEK